MTLPSRLFSPQWPRYIALSRTTWLYRLLPDAFRDFTTFPALNGGSKPPLPPRTPIPASDLTIAYLKGSGPGGQKINKTNSAVQIKHLPSGIVIKCQDTRSRDQNEKLAIRKLQDRLEEMEKGEDSRIGRRHELLRRRKKNAAKRARKKYGTKIEDGNAKAEELDDHDLEDGRNEVEPNGSRDGLEVEQGVEDTAKAALKRPTTGG